MGTVLGGGVLFAWSYVSHAALPWHDAGFMAAEPSLLVGFAGDLLAGFLATLLLLQLGPRSLVEKVLFLLTAAVLAWSGRAFGAMAWQGASSRAALVDLADLLIAWTFAGSALAWLVHPRAE